MSFRSLYSSWIAGLTLLMSVGSPSPGAAQTDPGKTTQPPTAKPPAPEVAALLKRGNDAAKTSAWDDALKYFNQALERSRALGDINGESDALRVIGNVYKFNGQPQKALDFFQQALSIARETDNKKSEARTLQYIGEIYRSTGDSGKAREMFEQALPILRQMGNPSDVGYILNVLGDLYRFLGQPQKALAAIHEALPLSRQANDRVLESSILLNLGNVYSSTGQMHLALKTYQEALLLDRKTGMKRNEAIELNDIGILYADTGQPRKALAQYQLAIPLFRETQYPNGEANAFNNAGTAYRYLGHPQKALECYAQALLLFRQIKNKPFEADTIHNIGQIYADMGQMDKALAFYQQAREIYRQIGSKKDEAVALLRIGDVYFSRGKFPSALDIYQEALPLHRQAEDRQNEATALAQIGRVYADTGQPQRALDYYHQALLLNRKAGFKLEEADVLGAMGDAHRRLGRPQQALAFYRQALAIFEVIGNRQGQATALKSLGLTYAALRQRYQALDYYRQAIEQVEQIRGDIGNDSDARAAFLQDNLEPYYRAIALLLVEHTPTARREAFDLAQKVKARSLLDRIGNARTDLNGRLTDEEREKEAALKAECDRLNRAMIAEGVTNEVGSKKRFESDAENLKKAEQALAIYRESLYARYPDLSARRVAKTRTFAEIARDLNGEDALLEYVRLKAGNSTDRDRLDQIVLFAVTRTGKDAHLSAFDLGPSDRFTALTSRLHDACSRPEGESADTSRRLYGLLLEKASTSLSGKRLWIVCPDDFLWQAPFAALQDSRGRFLLERHSLALAFSATGWEAARTIRRVQERPAEKTTAAGILAVADPTFGELTRLAAGFGNLPGVPGQRPFNLPDRPINIPDRPINIPDRPISLPDRSLAVALPNERDRANALRALPGTRKEADAIRAAFPGAMVLTGRDAQEEAVKKGAPTCRVLHLATHGFFNNASPLLSSLVLAEPPVTGEGSEEDGLLTAREILDLDLSHCELAVLSACNTGVGEQRSGEGIVGMTWCLTAAGCPSQVVSGWPVDDASTAKLMAAFYRNLKAGKDRAEALRAAALSVRNDRATAHPYYWAPFFLVGDAN